MSMATSTCPLCCCTSFFSLSLYSLYRARGLPTTSSLPAFFFFPFLPITVIVITLIPLFSKISLAVVAIVVVGAHLPGHALFRFGLPRARPLEWRARYESDRLTLTFVADADGRAVAASDMDEGIIMHTDKADRIVALSIADASKTVHRRTDAAAPSALHACAIAQ
nr:hypothetical protein [Pandoravirus belohorizontensis]